MAFVQSVIFVRPQFGNINLTFIFGSPVIVLLMTYAVGLHYRFLFCVKLLSIDVLILTDIVLLTSMNGAIQLIFLLWPQLFESLFTVISQRLSSM